MSFCFIVSKLYARRRAQCAIELQAFLVGGRFNFFSLHGFLLPIYVLRMLLIQQRPKVSSLYCSLNGSLRVTCGRVTWKITATVSRKRVKSLHLRELGEPPRAARWWPIRQKPWKTCCALWSHVGTQRAAFAIATCVNCCIRWCSGSHARALCTLTKNSRSLLRTCVSEPH